MTSMNAPLELRVLDTVGLTTPLAARQPRDPDARVGHDKWLPFDWQAADTATALEDLPPWYDSDAVAKARQALQTPEMAELFATYRAPMTMSRFLDNLAFRSQRDVRWNSVSTQTRSSRISAPQTPPPPWRGR
ncbi:hypothetical protein QP028_08540 [Corynebacterium suedekumii]|nr:hypothetical protein QP028_08540 [Corynebacterium suedekumii]